MLKNSAVVVIEQNCSYNCHWACVQGWVSCKVKHHEGQGAGAGQWKVTRSQEGGHSLTPTHTQTHTHIHTYTHTHTHTRSCFLAFTNSKCLDYPGASIERQLRWPFIPNVSYSLK